MSYTIKFTDFTNKGSITINDNTPNTTNTSLTFPGRNQKGYAVNIAENFLHMLENFSDSVPPSNPVEGQLWYNSTQNIEELKVWDGSAWKSASGIKKGSGIAVLTTLPAIIGDLYVDTAANQLYLYSGASWILVGPTYSAGNKSGVVAETIKDTNDLDQIVLKSFINGQVVAIYSIATFIPKIKIDGFSIINPGQNNSTKDFTGTGISNTKIWGTVEKAENLISNGKVVSASQFLRKDVTNSTDYSFNINNDGGLTVGIDGNLRLQVLQSIGTVYHARPDSALDLKILYNSQPTTLVRLDANKGYVGVNNLSPNRMLDVTGTGRFSGNVEITSTEDAVDDVSGSLKLSGGLVVGMKTRLLDDQTIFGQIITGYGIGSAILPLTNNQSDIGYVELNNPQNNLTFRNIYATTFNGNLLGNVTGNVSGNVNGTASKLTASTTFNMIGHVASTDVIFDGSTGGLTKQFTTTITQNIITDQTELTDTNDTDVYLMYRVGSGLAKTKKSSIVSNLSLVPTGAIFPFAGTVPPPGYLFCDGSEKRRASYPELFSVIQFTYGDPSILQGFGTFKLPDLRGRFPLGKLDMNNNDSVPNGADNGLTNISSGGGIPSPSDVTRSRDATSRILGNSNGSEQHTLVLQNLPDHIHSLSGDAQTQFYAINNNAGEPTDTGSFQAQKTTTDGFGQYINSTGGIENAGQTSQPFNIMNPYSTINYIIFVGKVIS